MSFYVEKYKRVPVDVMRQKKKENHIKIMKRRKNPREKKSYCFARTEKKCNSKTITKMLFIIHY
jgi:hypothetical protein